MAKKAKLKMTPRELTPEEKEAAGETEAELAHNHPEAFAATVNKSEVVRNALMALGVDAKREEINAKILEDNPGLKDFVTTTMCGNYISIQKNKMRNPGKIVAGVLKKKPASSGDNPLQTLQAIVDTHGKEFVQKLIGMM